jgi:hypothetical protein
MCLDTEGPVELCYEWWKGNMSARRWTMELKGELYNIFFFTGATTHCGFVFLQPSSGAIGSSHTRFLDHTHRRGTVGRTPLDE